MRKWVRSAKITNLVNFTFNAVSVVTMEDQLMFHVYKLVVLFVLIMMPAVLFAEQEKQEAKNAGEQQVMAEEKAEAKPQKSKAEELKELLDKSDHLWETRNKKGNDRQSILLAEQYLEKGGDEFEGKWRIARGCFWVAEQDNDKKVKILFGEKGWKAGERAAELKPARIEGWYWGVISLGQYSKGIGVAKAFFKGIAGTFEKMNKKAMQIDQSYGYAGPSRSFGRYLYSVPWPKRDLKESEKLLKKSISLYPKKLRSYFYLAETYLAEKKRDEARKALETCLSLDPKKEEYPDGIIFIKECKKLYAAEFSGDKK